MAAINPSLFKKYDIRGRAMGDDAPLTQDVARQIGRAFATYLQPFEKLNRVVVGRDNRHTSWGLQQAVMAGLTAAGCRAIDLGLVATPMVYWHAVERGDIGGVMVTGSHLPPDQNGFKLSIGGRTLFGEEIQAIRAIIEGNEFFYGGGEIETDHGSYSRYVHDLAGRASQPRRVRIVIDPGNGVGGLFAPRLLELWGHELIDCLFCEPDGSYPNHQPDPQDADNLRDLSQRVRDTGAEMGLAFDGDCDRVGLVDEQGAPIAADRILTLLARDMLKRQPGAAVVADVLTSQILFDEVERAGGRAIMAASGHSLVKQAMREHHALLGGEMSGHIFLGEHYHGFDDAFLVAGRIVALVGGGDQPLSALNAGLPTLFSTKEFRPHCADEHKAAVIEGVRQRLDGKGQINTVDGLRIKFERGWGLLRASNTEPVLSLRFEGQTESDALVYRAMFEDALADFPQVAALE
jgi:phosphomannomutase/phosphoglucomutase